MRFSNESLCYRPFVKDDREACLEIMDSNIPEFILPYERDLFLTCLDENPYPYRVVEKPGQGVVACGGFAFEKKLTDEGKRIASLCWGMVHTRRNYM